MGGDRLVACLVVKISYCWEQKPRLGVFGIFVGSISSVYLGHEACVVVFKSCMQVDRKSMMYVIESL